MTFSQVMTRANPSVFYRRDAWYYFRYDGLWLLLCLAAIGVMAATGWQGLELTWSPMLVVWLVLASYVQMLCHVFVHNCCHLNFPRSINRWVGEVCGAIILTRYASWEILHQRHHKHSDDPEKDPHPVNGGFLKFLHEAMLINLEKSLHDEYYERHGRTPETERREVYRSWLSYATMAALAVAWYMLLGPIAFFVIFVPSALAGITWIGHFNWRTHNGTSKDGDYRPINLNSGVYKVLNRLFFGTYFHKNHHEMVSLFNPMHYDRVMAAKAERRKARASNR